MDEKDGDGVLQSRGLDLQPNAVHTAPAHTSTMLRKRGADLDLPMASGGRSPTPPRRQLTMPDATPANVLSSIWVLVALALLAAGWVHCSVNKEESRLHCAEDVCRLSRDSPDSRRCEEATVCLIVYRRTAECVPTIGRRHVCLFHNRPFAELGTSEAHLRRPDYCL